MTEAQKNSELKKIRGEALTLNEYIKLSRIGESFTMTRTEKREVYSIYLDEINERNNNKRKPFATLSDKGVFAYNAITKHRDEVILETA